MWKKNKTENASLSKLSHVNALSTGISAHMVLVPLFLVQRNLGPSLVTTFEDRWYSCSAQTLEDEWSRLWPVLVSATAEQMKPKAKKELTEHLQQSQTGLPYCYS